MPRPDNGRNIQRRLIAAYDDTCLAIITKGEIVTNKDGDPIIEEKTQTVVRKHPNAIMMQAIGRRVELLESRMGKNKTVADSDHGEAIEAGRQAALKIAQPFEAPKVEAKTA